MFSDQLGYYAQKLKRPGTQSNRLGPDPADHLKYRPEPVRVLGLGSSVKTSGEDMYVIFLYYSFLY